MEMQTESGAPRIVPTLNAAFKTPFSLQVLAESFEESDAVYPGSPLPVHERWTVVLAWALPVREYGIFHDYTEFFKEAYASKCSQQVFAGLELANLQMHFYQFLLVNNLTFRHVTYMHFLIAQVWGERLGAKFNIMVDKKRAVPPKTTPALPRMPRSKMN